MAEFDTNLMKMIAAEVYSLVLMQTSREMFGKAYSALGMGEKLAVDAAVHATIQANFQGLTPEFFRTLSGQATQQAAGFQIRPVTEPEEKKSS